MRLMVGFAHFSQAQRVVGHKHDIVAKRGSQDWTLINKRAAGIEVIAYARSFSFEGVVWRVSD